MGSFGISESNITGEKKKQHRTHPTATTRRYAAQTVATTSSKWGLDTQAWAASLVLMVGTGLECPDDNLRALM